ncbi:MAG: HNH endonuclease [Methanobrevibacter sp.]|nr:HNH endonuclease [Methanobrevibacter sp.]
MKFDRMSKIYSKKQIDFLKKNFNNNSIRTLTLLFNKNFKQKRTEPNIAYACKCFCGKKGRYTQERVEKMKISAMGNKNRWKKTKPIGSERLDKDGYILVKVGFPRIEKRKQFVVWEKYNKPTDKKNDCIIFLDGNKQNCDIKNLFLMKRKYMGTLNFIKRGKETTPETLKSYISLAILYHETKNKYRSLKKQDISFRISEKKRRNDLIKQLKVSGFSLDDLSKKFKLTKKHISRIIKE